MDDFVDIHLLFYSVNNELPTVNTYPDVAIRSLMQMARVDDERNKLSERLLSEDAGKETVPLCQQFGGPAAVVFIVILCLAPAFVVM